MAEASPTPRYKAPVFAVFPFSPPGTFSYPAPNLDACDPSILRAIRYMEEASREPSSKPRRAKKKAKAGAPPRKGKSAR